MMRRLGTWLAVATLSAGLSACAQPVAETKPRWGFALDGNPITATQLADVARESGQRPALVVFFQQWPEDPKSREFPRASLDAVTAAGAEPVITWEPMFYRARDGAETMIAADAITRGDYDGYIEAFARAVAEWKKPVLMRFAHEMNLNRYHWGGTAAEYGAASPERFRAMWRRVVDIFRRVQATNARWVFCPNCESVPGAGNPAAAPWNTARAYYPGDDYVDVLGMDGYNWGDTQTPEKNGWRSAWRSFGGTFAALRAELRAIAPGKPLYVFETASAASGGDKRAWLAEMATTSAMWKLEGVVWFDVKKEVDWRLRTGVSAEELRPVREGFQGAK